MLYRHLQGYNLKSFDLYFKTKTLKAFYIFQVKLQTPMPAVPEGETSAHKTDVLLYLNPSCVYSVAVRPAISEMWGQIVRHYYPMLLSFLVRKQSLMY